jgi:hypothetical protein
MNRCRYRLVFSLMACLLMADTLAQGGELASPDFKDWRIVNRFRLFHPWFGLPAGEPLTLMNAGRHTDRLLALMREQDKEDESVGEARAQEPVFYSCLYALSNGEQADYCQGLNHGNYHELFNWNPLTNRYQAPPGVAFPARYTPGLVSGDWIIELELRKSIPAGAACKVALRYGGGAWKESERTECAGDRVRFVVPVSQLIEKPDTTARLAPAGVDGRPCSELAAGERGKCVAESIAVRVELGSAIVAEGAINPRDELLVAIGDSFGSGEGNPDLAGVLDRKQATPRFSLDPVWLDRRCNRSMHASPSRAAMLLAAVPRNGTDRRDRHSVSFLSFACSGAKITDGLLNRYDGVVGAPEVAEYLINQAHFGTTALDEGLRQDWIERLQRRYMPGMKPDSDIPAPFPAAFYHRLPSQLNALHDSFCADAPGNKEPAKFRMFRQCQQYLRSDLNLVVSIGGNDIGFASLIKDFVLSRSSDIATTRSWKAELDGGAKQIRDTYVRHSNHRKTIGLAQKLHHDIDYLDVLFAELDRKITDRKQRPRPSKEERASQALADQCPPPPPAPTGNQGLGLNDVYLIGYPSPNHDEKGELCHEQDFVGMPPFDFYLHISNPESTFAQERVVTRLGDKFQRIARCNDYIYVDVGSGVNASEKFGKRGWCARDASGANAVSPEDGADRCESESFVHDQSWKPYCMRARWFWTLADAGYTQGPLPLSAELPSGAMHPTFEAHRFIGKRIYEEILNLPPVFDPLGNQGLRSSAVDACPPDEMNAAQLANCDKSRWLMRGKFKLAVSDDHGLIRTQTTCIVQASRDGRSSPCPAFDWSSISGGAGEKATVEFAVGAGSLTEDRDYEIVMAATDRNEKWATRNYTIGIDRNKPVVSAFQRVPAAAGDAMQNEWATEGAIRVVATDSPRGNQKEPGPKDTCPGSGVESIRLYLAAGAEDAAPDKPACVLVPVRDSGSCSYSIALTFPEVRDAEKCRRLDGTGASPLGALARIWAQPVDVAGWIGDLVELPGRKIDLADPLVECHFKGSNCLTKDFKATVGDVIRFCARDDGGSGPLPPVISGLPTDTVPAPEGNCMSVGLKTPGPLNISVAAEDRSGRKKNFSWQLAVEALPAGESTAVESPSARTGATLPNPPQTPGT